MSRDAEKILDILENELQFSYLAMEQINKSYVEYRDSVAFNNPKFDADSVADFLGWLANNQYHLSTYTENQRILERLKSLDI